METSGVAVKQVIAVKQGIAVKQVIAVSVDPDTGARLEALAVEHERSKAYFVRKALDLYLGELEALQAEAASCPR